MIPDWFNGDPVGPDAMHGNVSTISSDPFLLKYQFSYAPQTGFSLQDWFAKHGPEETRAPLDKVIAALKAEGVTEFGITAYCFGARYAFNLAFEGFPKVIVASHPSLLKFPEDIEVSPLIHIRNVAGELILGFLRNTRKQTSLSSSTVAPPTPNSLSQPKR